MSKPYVALFHRRRLLSGSAALLAAAAALPSRSANAPDATGDWTGTLVFGSARLKVALTLRPDGSADFRSVDQSSTAMRASWAIAGTEIRLKVPEAQGEFTGHLAGDQLTGAWRQSGRSIPLTFTRPGAAPAAGPAAVPALTARGLETLRARGATPAIAAAWAKPGQATKVLACGARTLGGAVAARPDDAWHLGSISKTFTATLVGRLVDKGVVSWDDTVQARLGGVIPGIAPGLRDATFRHLLSHHASLVANLPNAQHGKYMARTDDLPVVRRAYCAEGLAIAPPAPIGSRFLYSNLGYTVVGTMLETTTGTPFETLMREELFTPLGLTSAGFGPPDPAEAPTGHRMRPDGGLEPARAGPGQYIDNAPLMAPGATVHASLPDLLRLLAAHRDQTDYLRPATWDRLHTPPFTGDYAMGLRRLAKGRFTHNGSNTLWYAEALIDQDEGVVCGAVANAFRDVDQAAVGEALLGAEAAAKLS